MNKKLLGLLIATESLFAVSCSQNWELPAPNADAETEEVTVTFSLSAEGGMASTRADAANADGDLWNISDGKQIDKLVYAVYVKEKDEKGKEIYTLQGFYGKGVDETSGWDEIEAGPGQTVLKTNKLLRTDEGDGGETITLRMMRGQEYVIGFWAQNSECKAYDTKNLEKVVVDYTNGKNEAGEILLAPNNDEVRDAYCQVHEFKAQTGVVEEVILKRAMAQINVGTAGWDYNAELDYGYNYAYSSIVMKGLYDQLNVLTGEVDKTDAVKIKVGEEETDKEITYTWNILPAYIHNSSKYTLETGDYDATTHETCKTWLGKNENNSEYLYVKLTSKGENEGTDNQYQEGTGIYAGKYFLKYLTDEPEQSTTSVTTEVFKYLSMCYVLAPTYAPNAGNDGLAKGGTTIDEVTFYLSETKDGKVYLPNAKDKTVYDAQDASYRFSIKNVPIQRNWRTNILGGTRGTETTLFDPRSASIWIDLSPSYDGEHNYNGNTQGDVSDKEHNEWTTE